MQASRLSQGGTQQQAQDASAGVAAPSNAAEAGTASVTDAAVVTDAAALAVNQALDSEPPELCLQLDSTTQPELMPLQDPTPMVHIQAHISQLVIPVNPHGCPSKLQGGLL